MLRVEFANIETAKSSLTALKEALQGVATVENGPFPEGGTAFVRLAVSVAPAASADPVLRKVRALAGVKDVAIVR